VDLLEWIGGKLADRSGVCVPTFKRMRGRAGQFAELRERRPPSWPFSNQQASRSLMAISLLFSSCASREWAAKPASRKQAEPPLSRARRAAQ
jgi:hypothetical protein